MNASVDFVSIDSRCDWLMVSSLISKPSLMSITWFLPWLWAWDEKTAVGCTKALVSMLGRSLAVWRGTRSLSRLLIPKVLRTLGLDFFGQGCGMWDPCPVAVSLLIYQTKSGSRSYLLCIMGSLIIRDACLCQHSCLFWGWVPEWDSDSSPTYSPMHDGIHTLSCTSQEVHWVCFPLEFCPFFLFFSSPSTLCKRSAYCFYGAFAVF